nr:FtsX-like permease family protein [Sphingomonas quercus]
MRLGLRDLRGGIGGLRLLAICLLLGVAALAGVGSLSAAILSGLAAAGQGIVGGDIEMRVSQRRAAPDELAAFARTGLVSETIRMRAMASRLDGAETALVELKGVDARYPLYGSFRLAPGALRARPGPGEVAVAPALADRLRLRIGDSVRIGDARLRLIGFVAEEPDRLGEGFTLGPVAIAGMDTLHQTGLVMPGSLYQARYRIKLPPAIADAHATAEALERRFPLGGWETRDRTNAAPSLRRFITRLGQFLSLVGLAALAVAGIGVGNGVSSWLDGKRRGIAVLKALGADSRTIFLAYLAQIGIVAAIGVAAGLVIGALVPPAVGALAGDALPVRPGFALHPLPMVVAAAYGLLVALLFSLAPLARARAVTAASLFRGGVEPMAAPGGRVRLLQGGLALAIAALAILGADDRMIAAGFIAGVAGLLALLAGIGVAVRRIAAALPRPRRPLARLAIANLHRPGAPTGQLVVALGLGLTLFATLAVIETSLGASLTGAIPARAPSFFVLDLPKDDAARFRELVAARAPRAEVRTVPMLRGAVVEIGGRRVEEMKDIPSDAWMLRGDRGLTYAASLPAGSRVVEGKWWPGDYRGPPLVSIDVQAARALGLKIGDSLTVSVLGVEIPAHIASFREIEWDTMGFNFAILFAPGVLEAAPHTVSATIAVAPSEEPAISRAVTADFPSASLIRVKDVIGQVATVLGQMGLAIRAAGSVAVLAGIAVLVGAVAASRRQRVYDAVLLKLLGATRAQVLAAQALEFALLALALAILALVFGAAGGWYVVTRVLELEWAPDWRVVLATLALGGVGTLVIGLLATLPALNARPARALRDL